MRPVRCTFYVRSRAEGLAGVGLFRYDALTIPGPDGDSAMHTEFPPLVGDLVHLNDREQGGTYEVLARDWLHPSWGSMNWPYGEQRPVVGPMLTLLVERADGLFVNEAPTEEE